MRKSPTREPRIARKLTKTFALAAVGGAAALVAAELRNRKALATDPLWTQLSIPLRGEPVPVVSADGTVLHAEIFYKHDAPTVVLVPGWTEEVATFELLTRAMLRRGFQVVSYDLRGQGQSARGRGLDQRIERYGEDLQAVLAATCPGRDDVVLAGHSMGGMSVMSWAAAFPVSDSVRAVALITTAAVSVLDNLKLLPGMIPLTVRRQILEPALSSNQKLMEVSTPISRAIGRRLAFGPHASAAMVAFNEQMTWRMDPKLRAGAATTMGEMDLMPGVAKLNVPTLVVGASDDRLTPPAAHSERIAAALPNLFELVVLPETGHMVQLERPEELADAITRLALAVGIEPGEPAVAV